VTNNSSERPLWEKEILFLSNKTIVKRIGNKKGNIGLMVKPPTILPV
jgi:hypothetical protein